MTPHLLDNMVYWIASGVFFIPKGKKQSFRPAVCCLQESGYWKTDAWNNREKRIMEHENVEYLSDYQK